jgi:hypothetical protein
MPGLSILYVEANLAGHVAGGTVGALAMTLGIFRPSCSGWPPG